MTWFVVTSRAGRLCGALYHDDLPAWCRSKRAKEKGLVRLIELPGEDGETSLAAGWRLYWKG